MTQDQITTLIDQLGDHAQALTHADPAHKADLYAKLGLHLTYHPTQHTMRVEAHLDTRTPWVNGLCPRPKLNQSPTIVIPFGHVPLDAAALVDGLEG